MLLIVDDDRESRELLAEFLSLKGFVVRSASNGCDALRLLANSPTRPDLILLDLQMPVLDGWGFLAQRASDPLISDVPIVIITVSGGVTHEAIEAGAVAVLRKPMEPQTLLRVVELFRKDTPRSD